MVEETPPAPILGGVRPVRLLHLVGVIALSATAAVLALSLVHVSGDVGPGRVELQAGIAAEGGTTLGLPPLGQVSATTHRTPLLVRATVEQIDVERVQRLLEERDPEHELRSEAEEDLRPLLRRFAFRGLLVAFLAGGAAAALVPGRRWHHVAAGAAVGTLTVAAVFTFTWRGFDPDAFDEPRYDGPIERAPEVVAAVQRHVGDFEEIRGRVQTLSGQLTRLYALTSTEAGSTDGADVRILHVTDLHLNPLGVEITQNLARRFGVDAILDTGDLTTFGLPVEARIGDLIRRMPAPYYFVPGNHDSPENRENLARVPGLTLVDGRVVNIEGVRILGIGDPTFTAGTNVSNAEARATKEQHAPKVAEQAEARRPDVLAVHDPLQARDAFGHVPLVVAGHLHQTKLEEHDGTVLLVGGSTGATGLGSFTVKTDLPYEAQVLHFSDRRLVAIDFLSLEGVSGNFRLERRVFAPDDEDAEDGDSDDAESRRDDTFRPLAPSIAGPTGR